VDKPFGDAETPGGTPGVSVGEILVGVAAAGGIIALFATGHWIQGLVLLVLVLAVGYFYFKRKRGE
jgi:4-hydroxybenzoate polyprenyltransferase